MCCVTVNTEENFLFFFETDDEKDSLEDMHGSVNDGHREGSP